MENPNFVAQKLKVRELFDRGVPFFTKSALEKLKDQMDSIKSMAGSGRSTDGQKFVFSSITGQKVERPVLKGLAQSRQFGKETVLLEPCLLYSTYQSLINHRYSDQALCPLQICYGGHNEQQHHHNNANDTRNAFQAYRGAWEASEDCLRLKSSMAAAASLPGITKIIAFACSSISRDVDQAVRSASQHALILTLRDVLQASQPGVQIRCLAQDPVYTGVDKTVLSEVGITVVDDPQGFLEVDDQSVVLSFSPNVPVRQIITDLARPVILAWDTVLTEEQTIGRWAKVHEPPKSWAGSEELEACLCDPESARVRAMIQEEYFQVEKLGAKGFGDASVYIRGDGRRT
ncbi:hypothetical protein UCDDA912_g07591 [Diaporthe ampelina]|uniref:SRR1-like domain-containing protein n=1 Tax=Diaporthe ampelina TaxID=1214573 RepID=A0A0G2FE96_9PEZI|nr:hypothetical protein UCDDA912_g07591 [Diaporthe ampelina]